LIGLTHQVIASVKATLDYIPDPEYTNICIVVYNTSVLFFTFTNEVTDTPSIICMGDINNPFGPIPGSLAMFNVKKDRRKIDSILDKIIPITTSSPRIPPGSCGGAALRSAIELLKDNSGKVLWFAMDIPSLGFGAVKDRTQPTLFNTDKEHTLLLPDEKNIAYSQVSELCFNNRIAIDIFACPQSDIDLPTLSTVTTSTGGEIKYYRAFNLAEYGEKLHFDIFRNLTRYTVYDVSFNARCSVGLSIHKYYGSFGETFKGPIPYSVFDSDKCFSFTIRQDEKLKPGSIAYIQLAVLYTTGRQERKVRVFNYSLHVTSQMIQVYSSIDLEAVLALEARLGGSVMMQLTVNDAREKLCQDCISILAYYRKTVSTVNDSIQFVLPESMKIFPLMILGLLRTPAFGYIEDHKIDERVVTLLQLHACSFPWLFMKVYPRMYKVNGILDECQDTGTFIENGGEYSQSIVKPVNIPTSMSKMSSVNAYLIVSSDYIYLYLPADVSESILLEVFGKSTLEDIAPEEGVPVLETKGNERIRNVIEHFRKEVSGAYQQVVIAPYSSLQAKFIIKNLMVEDSKNLKRELSYVQFLSYTHKMILAKLKTF